MGLDPFSPVAPACIRVLLLPVGKVRQSRFESFVKRLEPENVVRLGDVSPDSRPHRTLFSPLAFPEGLVVYDLSTTWPPPSHIALTAFELYRQPLLIIGVIDGKQEEYSQPNVHTPARGEEVGTVWDFESLQRTLDNIKSDFQEAFLHNILIFDKEARGLDLPRDVICISSPEKSRTTTIKTVMCDLTSHLLGEMGPFARLLQSQTSIDSPKASDPVNAYDGLISAIPKHLHRSAISEDRARSSSPASGDHKSAHRASFPVRMPGNKNARSSPTHSPPLEPSGLASSHEGALERSESKRRASSNERSRTDSRDRGSQQYESSNIKERERIRGRSRIGVVLGSMYLLAGRWPDAVKELVQSANAARANSDYVWQAKALDYLLVCHLMYAWAGMDFRISDVILPALERPGSFKPSKHSKSPSVPDVTVPQNVDPARRQVTLRLLTDCFPDLVDSVLNLYTRAWTFTDDKIPPFSYSTSAIRFCKLLTAVRKGRGHLSDGILRHAVLNTPGPLADEGESDTVHSQSTLELCSLLMRAYPTSDADSTMAIDDRTIILSAIAALLSQLGFHRKKAFILNELTASLLPALVQARKDGAAEMGMHPAASLASLSATPGKMSNANNSSRRDDPEHNLGELLILVCQAYGITTIPTQQNATSIFFVVQQTLANHVGPRDLKLIVLQSCIHICEALPDLSGALHYSAELLRTAGSGSAPGPDNTSGSPVLPIDEQVRLANNISRTIGAAQSMGLGQPEADYWDEFLVRGIESVSVHPSRMLSPHAKSELDMVEKIEADKEKNPFIYNPFLKLSSAATEPLLAADEMALFQVTLQNLFDFDLHVEQIQLQSLQAHFVSQPQSVMIGPYRTQTLLLGGTPTQAGPLIITGCLAKIRGCRERAFRTYRDPWKLRITAKRRELKAMQDDRSVAFYTAEQKSAMLPELPREYQLALKVINTQPSLRLADISLPQSSVMLLEGETKRFSVTLYNASPHTAADLVLLSFQDSKAVQVQSLLADKELSKLTLYELELLARETSIRWDRRSHGRAIDDHDVTIAAKQARSFDIEVLGRHGLTWAEIQVDYGSLGIPRSAIEARFYTLQLKIPLLTTTHASIVLSHGDIIAIGEKPHYPQRLDHTDTSTPSQTPTSSTSGGSAVPSPITENHRTKEATTARAMLVYEFRNAWSSSLDVELTYRNDRDHSQADDTDQVVTRRHSISPNESIKVILPIPKLYLPPSRAHALIPTLDPATTRQFVVSTPKHSLADEMALREAFWYREALLSRLSARWTDQAAGRCGKIDMRGWTLTERMMSNLRLNDVDIQMTILAAEDTERGNPDEDGRQGDVVKETGQSTYTVPTCTFVALRTTVYNRSDQDIHARWRAQPTLKGQAHNTASDLGKKLVINGISQQVLPLLKPGEQQSVEVGFCILSAGVYEWNASVEEIKYPTADDINSSSKDAKTEHPTPTHLDLHESRDLEQRRIWHGENPCTVVGQSELLRL